MYTKTLNKLFISGIFLSMMLVLALVLPGTAGAQAYGCSYHSSERCNGNYLYWYDSCGNQQDVAQYCVNGCYGNSCQYNNSVNNNYNNYNNYSNCTYHAYKLCSGNNIYWYDSCNNQQDLYSPCTNGLVCQYGQCVAQMILPATPATQPASNYTAHFKTACYGNSIQWFDSLGSVSGLYKSCSDGNGCTLDTCANDKCTNTLKCDGSTCAIGSADYNADCPANSGQAFVTIPPSAAVQPSDSTHCGNGLCEATLGETNANCPADCKLSGASAAPVAPGDAANSAAAVSSAPATTGFMGFLKHWYAWILVALILIFLFVVVFRRLSSET